MVPVPVARAMLALLAPDRPTLKVSLGSTAVSPLTVIATPCAVTPGAKVSVPERAT
ncbi:hypothetical protein CPBF1521_44450 [Xanthomonas arboricola pv. juglandis]|nr:hypothetical protein CPBF1521_44450 [Xanthomonas arboricola pv. juglandis]